MQSRQPQKRKGYHSSRPNRNRRSSRPAPFVTAFQPRVRSSGFALAVRVRIVSSGLAFLLVLRVILL